MGTNDSEAKTDRDMETNVVTEIESTASNSTVDIFGTNIVFEILSERNMYIGVVQRYHEKYQAKDPDIETGILYMAILCANKDAVATARLDDATKEIYFDAYPDLADRVKQVSDIATQYTALCSKYNSTGLNLQTLEWEHKNA